MRIAVLSDTHDKLPPQLPGLVSQADEIWHLGDVGEPELLRPLYALGLPLWVVRGNCDSHSGWPHSLTFDRAGLRFHLVHIPPGLAPLGIQVLLHGHTHRPRDQLDAFGVRWLNPGSASQPRGGSAAGFAWLELVAEGGLAWQQVRL